MGGTKCLINRNPLKGVRSESAPAWNRREHNSQRRVCKFEDKELPPEEKQQKERSKKKAATEGEQEH